MIGPRRACIGASLAAFGRLSEPSVFREGVTLGGAEAGTLLLLLRSSHPPAGTTVLIASLGYLRTPRGVEARDPGMAAAKGEEGMIIRENRDSEGGEVS